MILINNIYDNLFIISNLKLNMLLKIFLLFLYQYNSSQHICK